MHNRISQLLALYERGELGRRDLVQGLALLAAAAFPSAPASAASTFKGVDVQHIDLNVTDVKRSRDFYQKHLGLPVLFDSVSGRSCVLGLGKSWLVLSKGPTPGLNHFCFSIEDFEVKRATAELSRQGLNPDQPAGSSRVYFSDPDGILLQVSSIGLRFGQRE